MVEFTATFTDPDGDDAHTTTFDFGSQPVVNSSLTASHAYTQVGVYIATLTAQDDVGGVDSPEGACPDLRRRDGKANFGFVSKYTHGQRSHGQTEFRFNAGGLNFHSSSYQWLVVAGARAQLKGDGTIKGTGDFGFLPAAVHGQEPGGGGVDKFRIKIIDKATDTVAHDTQPGEADDPDAAR